MFGFFTKTLQRKLISIMIIAALVAVSVVSFFAVRYSSEALYDLQINFLKEDLQVLSNDFIKERMIPARNYLNLITANNEIMTTIKNIHDTVINLQEKTSSETDKAAYEKDIAALDSLVKFRMDFFHYFRNIFVFCDHQTLVYDLNQKNRMGLKISSLSEGPLKKTLDHVFKTGKPALSDMDKSNFNRNEPTQYLAVPVIKTDGSFEFVFVASVSPEWLEDGIYSFSTSAKEKDVDVHIVATNGLIKGEKNGQDSILTEMKGEVVNYLKAKKTWAGITKDEKGVEVAAATIPIDTSILKNLDCIFNWGIITEVPMDNLLAPVYKFIKDISIVSIIILLIFIFVAFLVAKAIAKPISILSSSSAKVASGDLCVQLDIKTGKDEIGTLINSFKNMIESLKNQITQTASASAQLSASMQEISSTITELSSSATETSSAVNEITSTIEEVRQISNVANKKAEDMSGKADGVRTVADEGKASTERVSDGIIEINKQVESIASTTIKLGEQTKNISEIIDSVTDIADQSNLLSVNASIEAAKAGEYGKGFAVVAREIKSLADKSKESTKQVKAILTDIQKSATGAIMATEKGTKTVAEGLELSKVSKTSIEKLESSIGDAVEISTQIVASSKEQLNGMNQLFETVGSIKAAMQQNAAGVKQLEQEVKNLTDLAKNLDDMTKKFKVK